LVTNRGRDSVSSGLIDADALHRRREDIDSARPEREPERSTSPAEARGGCLNG
jgi:hypothetical protein